MNSLNCIQELYFLSSFIGPIGNSAPSILTEELGAYLPTPRVVWVPFGSLFKHKVESHLVTSLVVPRATSHNAIIKEISI